jgi:hypothetical protein
MGYNDDFFGSSFNDEDVKNVSRWEVDRILNTVSTLKKGSSKKHRISDEEIDKILSEKFIPIIQKENNKNNTISDSNEENLSDIAVIGENRHNSSETDEKQLEIRENIEEKQVNDEIQQIDTKAENTEKAVSKNKKRKKSSGKNNFLVSLLSFLCLALCVLLCILLVSTKR